MTFENVAFSSSFLVKKKDCAVNIDNLMQNHIKLTLKDKHLSIYLVI